MDVKLTCSAMAESLQPVTDACSSWKFTWYCFAGDGARIAALGQPRDWLIECPCPLNGPCRGGAIDGDSPPLKATSMPEPSSQGGAMQHAVLKQSS